MKKRQIILVAGARPNFIKVAPIVAAIEKARSGGHAIAYRLVHTGQHYDSNMSGRFFEELGIPDPDVNLGVGDGSQAEQTAAIMVGFEKVLEQQKPDLCLVVGDVNSTMACAIVARKMGIKVAHVEAGIRSRDWSMPEEINRIVTDSISNYFFTTSESAGENLVKEGAKREAIFFVGNTMIDTLQKNMQRFRKPGIWKEFNLKAKEYFVLTLHRPANVDEEFRLLGFLREIRAHSRKLPVIFPVHPRTGKTIKALLEKASADSRNILDELCICDPLSYLEFNYLVKHAKAVLTDSGGITEETTVMGVPCMTLRDNTERPETVSLGTNELIGTDPKAIAPAMEKLFSGQWKTGSIPLLWDGCAAERIVKQIVKMG